MLLDKYQDVLRRPEQRRAHGLPDDDLRRFLRGLLDSADLAPTRLERRVVLVRDPSDATVVEVAIDGGADHIVTHNPRHFEEAARLVSVLTPGALLRTVVEGKP